MRKNKNSSFYIGGLGLDRTDDFQKFGGSGLDRIQFYRIRTGLGLKNFTVRSSLFYSEIYITNLACCEILTGESSTWTSFALHY